MELVNQEVIQDLASTLNLLSDPVRLSIVMYLIDEPSSVGTIANDLKISQPLVSHHLRVLKASRVVKATKSGKNVIYELINKGVKEIILLALKNEVR